MRKPLHLYRTNIISLRAVHAPSPIHNKRDERGHAAQLEERRRSVHGEQRRARGGGKRVDGEQAQDEHEVDEPGRENAGEGEALGRGGWRGVERAEDNVNLRIPSAGFVREDTAHAPWCVRSIRI